jgi:hypothetical protein
VTKSATKRAIRQLPALRTSLIWFKRETVRTLERRAQDAASPRLRIMLAQKARKIREADLADLRLAYQADRVSEIARSPKFELSHAVPGIIWMEV